MSKHNAMRALKRQRRAQVQGYSAVGVVDAYYFAANMPWRRWGRP